VKRDGSHICNLCGCKMKVIDVLHFGETTMRKMECLCGNRGDSVESVTRWHPPVATRCNPLAPVATGTSPLPPVATGGIEVDAPTKESPPLAVAQPPVASAGGVGGGLPSGQGLIRKSDPNPSSIGSQTQTRVRGEYRATPRVFIAAKTPAFLDLLRRYTRRDKKEAAAQVWAELSAAHPGGEAALHAEILASFEAGILNRPQYRGPIEKRPCFDTFLAERRWDDPESDPEPEQKAPQSFRDRDEQSRQDRRVEEKANGLTEDLKSLPWLTQRRTA
jgi:hypothetical protein